MGPWYQNNILKKAENKFIYQGDNIKQTTQKYKKIEMIHVNNQEL